MLTLHCAVCSTCCLGLQVRRFGDKVVSRNVALRRLTVSSTTSFRVCSPHIKLFLKPAFWVCRWEDLVTVVSADMRHWEAPHKADMLVSELLGSFGDNELSPECLDGAQRFLREGGVSIPTSYTSFLQPITTSKLWNDVKVVYTGAECYSIVLCSRQPCCHAQIWNAVCQISLLVAHETTFVYEGLPSLHTFVTFSTVSAALYMKRHKAGVTFCMGLQGCDGCRRMMTPSSFRHHLWPSFTASLHWLPLRLSSLSVIQTAARK